MAKVPNGVEKLPKFRTAWIGRTSVTDRQTTDGRATANSEREREFTFAKNQTDSSTTTHYRHPAASLTVTHASYIVNSHSTHKHQPSLLHSHSLDPATHSYTWPGTRYVHFRGLLLPDGILPGTKFTLRPRLAFSYIGSTVNK